MSHYLHKKYNTFQTAKELRKVKKYFLEDSVPQKQHLLDSSKAE